MRKLVFSLLLFAVCTCGHAAEALTKFGVVLLQPDHVLQARVPSVSLLASYIRAVEEVARSAILAADQRFQSGGFIVVAVRPGPRSNVWVDFEPALPVPVKNAVVARVRAVEPLVTKAGPVVFAIKVGVWGGAEPARTAPAPAEWKAAAQKAGRALETGELVELIWSD